MNYIDSFMKENNITTEENFKFKLNDEVFDMSHM